MWHHRPMAGLVVLAVASLSAAGCADSPVAARTGTNLVSSPSASPLASAGTPATALYRVHLDALNGSGVRGTATVAVRRDELTVILNAVGHVVGRTHAQHIHGFTDGTDGSCPPAGFDGGDGDGILTVGEGAPFYGPVQLPLTPFPTPANEGGAISYTASFPVSGLAFAPEDLERKSMVLHGAFVEGDFVGSLPVACGTVERVN